ncbi:MAG: ImmA/IrrE family metallo-endopeptidase [Anaerolineaceae bacterium]
MPDRVNIKPGLFEWAISESQLPFDVIKAKFPLINEWIDNTKSPTFNQLNELANFLHVPFGYLFLDEPPLKEELYAEFRAIANKKPLMSKNLEDTLYEMSLRQNWMSDYRESQGWDPLPIVGTFDEFTISEITQFIYKNLGVVNYWGEKARTYRDSFVLLKRKLEELGVLIMQNSIVGTNTHRKLDVHEFRGFVLLDRYAPLIFVNSNDSIGGKIFTLMHEFVHILLGDDDIFDKEEELESRRSEERMINRIASNALIPDSFIEKLSFFSDQRTKQINDAAKQLKVSPLSLAIRLVESGKISQTDLELIKLESYENYENFTGKSDTGKPDFFVVFNSKVSQPFSDAVISQTLSGEISFTYAYKLLGIRGKTFDKFKDIVLSHE